MRRLAWQRPFETVEHGNSKGAAVRDVAFGRSHGWDSWTGTSPDAVVVEFEAARVVAQVVTIMENLEGRDAVAGGEGREEPVDAAGTLDIVWGRGGYGGVTGERCARRWG